MKITFNCVGFHDRRTLCLRWLGSSLQRKRFKLRQKRPDLQIRSLYGAQRG